MARTGVTQEQVNAAADALLLTGERPTIDRVRQKLGTGSPNTLIRLMDAWWSDVGRRLALQEAKLLIPEAPQPVVDAAAAFWTSSLEHASVIAEVALKHEREVLQRERGTMAEREADLRTTAEQAQRETELAQEAQALAETRLQDIERLVDAQVQQLSELHDQRAALATELTVTVRRAESAEEKLSAQVTAAASQREALEAQHRAIESRWLQEVDRARQEAAKTLGALNRVEAEAAIEARRAGDSAKALHSSLRDAERAQIAGAATIKALETEVARLHRQLSDVRGKAMRVVRKPRLNPAASTAARKRSK